MIFSLSTNHSSKYRSNPNIKLPWATLSAILWVCASLQTTHANASVLGDYFKSTSAELVAFVDVYTKSADPGVTDNATSLWTELALQNYVSFSDSISLETELVFTLTEPNLQSGMFTSPGVINPEPAYADFRTFMLTWRGTNTEIKIGKGVIELGLAEIYTPIDRFRSQNYSTPQHFNDRGDLQLSISRFFTDSELSLTLLPYNEDFIDPPIGSRWLNSRGDRDFFSQIGAKDEDRPHSFPDDWGYLLKYSGVSRGFDYYLAAHYGPGAYPIIQLQGIVIPPKTKKTYPTATSAMAGIVATTGSWSFYADVLYQKTEQLEDDSFARWAVGFSYRETTLANKLGLIEIKPIFTYSGHKVVEDSDPSLTLFNSEDARPHPDSLLGRFDIRFTDKSMLYFFGSVNFKDEDSSFGFGLRYNHSDSLLFSVHSLYMHGRDNTQFGRWRSNDFVSVGFNYRF